MLSSKDSKQCKSTSVTGVVSDMVLKILRDDKFNPVTRPDRWFLRVLDTRIKEDVLKIYGLKDSQIEICQYKSHGSQTQSQIGIKVKISTVTAQVNVHTIPTDPLFCSMDLTGTLKAKLRNVEIDAEVTAELNPKDLSNVLIADLLKFDLRWGGSPEIDLDFRNEGGIIDWFLETFVGFYEAFTNGISKKLNEAEEKLKNFILDTIPFCVKRDAGC